MSKDGTMEIRKVSYRDIVKQIGRFIVCIFAVSWLAAIPLARFYYVNSINPDKHMYTMLILAAVGFSMPIMTIVTRVSIKAYLLGVEQAERLSTIIEAFQEAYDKAPNLIKNVEAVMDKALPIANNVEEIVARAKGMANDVELITHKVRVTMDGLNGSLDIKVLGSDFKEIKDSLKTIADTFSGSPRLS